MTQPIQGPDGNLYQFPDGTMKDAAVSYFRKKGIGVHATAGPVDESKRLGVENPNTDTAAATPGFLNTLGREGSSLLGLLRSMVPETLGGGGAFYHAAADPESAEESQEYGKGFEKKIGPMGRLIDRTAIQPVANAAKWYRDASQGKVPNAIEQFLGAAPEGIGTGAGAVVAGKGAEVSGRAIKASPNAVRVAVNGRPTAEGPIKSITDAVNPPAKEMAGFQKSLGHHLDKVVTFAAKKGIPLDSVENLGKAMKEASAGIRTHYYEQVLGPFKNNPVDITAVKGYSGETGGTPSSATLGQLDARLSQINAEMNSKFNKPTESAVRAAVKSDAELNAEAAGIRSVLYPQLAKATGLTAETIGQTRQAFGALDGLAEKTSASAMQSRSAANKAAQEPITINPLSNTKTFVADKALNKMRGNPVANAIKTAVGKADVKPYELPKPNPAAAASATRSAPIRGDSHPIGSVAEPSAAERSAVGDRVSARGEVNKAARTAKAAKLAARTPPRTGSSSIGDLKLPTEEEISALRDKLVQRRVRNAVEDSRQTARRVRHPFWQGDSPQ